MFEGLFEAAPDATVAVDERGLIRFVNEQAERLFGYPRGELVGRPIELLIPERFHPAHRAHVAGFVADPHPRPMGGSLDLFARRRDGSTFQADVSLAAVATVEGYLFVAAIRDVTERRRVEKTLVALNEIAFALGSTPDTTRLTEFSIGRVRALFGVDVVSLYWWSAERAALELLARTGPPAMVAVQRIDLGRGPQGIAFQRREPVVLDDYAGYPERLTPEPELRSVVAVPLLVGERAVGTLFVGSVSARHWQADEVRTLTLFASQIAPAIEASQLVEQLQRQGELHASVLQAQSDLHEIVVLLRGDEIVYANAALAEVTGRKPAETGGLREALAAVVTEEREAASAHWAAARESPQRFETRIRRPDGAVRRLEVALAPVLPGAAAGEALLVVAVARDVTESAAAQERFERMFRSNPSGVVLSRLADGIIIDVNERFLDLLGFARDEVVGRTGLVLDLFADPAERRHLVEDLEATGSIRDREVMLRASDGTLLHTLVSAEVVELGAVPHILVAAVDITARKRLEAELERLALHDALTGLPNRALFHDRLGRAIAAAGRGETGFTVLYLDLDDFKEVNDAFGHDAGDELLRAVGERLLGALRGVDTVARFGGDEFAVLLPGAGDADAVVAARRVLDELRAPFAVSEREVHLEASAGVVLWPNDGRTADELLRHADVAMYAAKRGAGGYAFYATEQDPRSEARLSLRADLHGAIERGELFLEYQPMVDLRTGACVRVEALVRWRHPVRGVVPPDEFIPFAEESGFIRPLGLWVLEEALARCAECRADGVGPGVAVNLSARNLLDPGLVGRITELLARWAVPAGSFMIEITESAVMNEPERTLGVLRALHELGVRLAVDDFGTGYSSLSYLQRLPVAEVKVDRSFVGRMMDDPNSAAIVRSTIDLGHSLGLEVTAEGVEDERTRERLRALGCDVIQGYLIARPLPADGLRAWLHGRAVAPG